MINQKSFIKDFWLIILKENFNNRKKIKFKQKWIKFKIIQIINPKILMIKNLKNNTKIMKTKNNLKFLE